MKLKFIFLLALLKIQFISFNCIGQTNSISGTIRDINGQPLSYATITLYKTLDSSILNFKLSDNLGNFIFKNIPSQMNLRVIVSHIGFKPFKKELFFDSSHNRNELHFILEETQNTLDEVLVSSERPPIIFRKDTIEYNVIAFKTLPNSLLEDLLKKLPGINIEKNGEIKFNGKIVTKIMIDGRDFFTGDTRIATKNLPSNIIEKVQITDEINEIENLPNGINKIINLKLKKSIKKGLIGKFYAGIGTNSRYETGAIINTFKDTLQLSLLSYSNNLNKSSFGIADLQDLGGFKRSGTTNLKSMQSNLSLSGLSLGGSDEGIELSNGYGINLNSIIAKSLNLNFQYFFGKTNNILNKNSYSIFDIGDKIIKNKLTLNQNTLDQSQLISTTIKWKLNKFINITYTPTLLTKYINQNKITTQNISNENTFNTNISNTILEAKLNQMSINNSLNLITQFKKTGRSFSANFKYISNYENKHINNNSNYNYFNPTLIKYIFDQNRLEIGKNRKTYISMSFREPLTKNDFFRLTNLLENSIYSDNITTHDKNIITNSYDSLNNFLSGAFKFNTIKNNTSLIHNHIFKNLNLSYGIDLQMFRYIFNEETQELSKNNYLKLFPKINTTFGDFTIEYFASINEQSFSNIMPINDNNNPFYIAKGNINLIPEINHTIYIDYNKFNFEKNKNINLYIDAGITNNSLITYQVVDKNNVTISYPINSDKSFRIGSSFMWGKKVNFNKKGSLTIRSSINPLLRISDFKINEIACKSYSISLKPSFGLSFSTDEIFDYNIKYTYGIASNFYSSKDLQSNIFNIHNIQSEIIIHPNSNLVIESVLDLIINPKNTNLDKNHIIKWNSSISYMFLKNKNGQLKFSIIDILNQNIKINRIVTLNQITENQVQSIPRYLLISLIYNVKNLNFFKKVKHNSFF